MKNIFKRVVTSLLSCAMIVNSFSADLLTTVYSTNVEENSAVEEKYDEAEVSENAALGEVGEADATPTPEPTAEATVEPTTEPSAEPTAVPSVEPTTEPSAEPTAVPSVEPTAEPSADPTAEPAAEPTAEPTVTPTPTATPTPAPDTGDIKVVLTLKYKDTKADGYDEDWNTLVRPDTFYGVGTIKFTATFEDGTTEVYQTQYKTAEADFYSTYNGDGQGGIEQAVVTAPKEINGKKVNSYSITA